MRIVVDGPEAALMESMVRAATGFRPPWETWIVSLVKQRSMWAITVLVSPDDRLAEWSFVGPAEAIGPALKEAMRDVGLDNPERRIRDLPHWPERRRSA